jgi:predicted metal-binding membrane protein
MTATAVARRTPYALILVLAGVGWAVSIVRMQGMDAGPTVSLGTFGWFAVTWVVMMAAMMFPVIAPEATSASPGVRSAPAAPVRTTGAFLVAYLAVWTVVGAAVFGALRAGDALTGGSFAWDQGGKWLVAGVLVLAAGFQLTGVKRRSLERCRTRLDASAPSRRSWGVFDAASAGLRAGVRCLACSWALMLVLFALGAMSLVWMAVVTVLIAAERLLPVSRPARLGAAAVLAALALGVALVPASVPGLSIPGTGGAMTAMGAMR